MNRIDLHTHSSCSDGLLSPIELLERAADFSVNVLSITDHDSTEAYTDSLYEKAKELGINLIPGVEISTIDTSGARAHILGLGIDPANDDMLMALVNQNLAREAYTAEVVEKLIDEGWKIRGRNLLQQSVTITKAHIAREVIDSPRNTDRLTSEFGTLPTTGRFIETYLLKGQACYVASEMMTPQEAVQAIHAAGGIASYAHPVANLYEAEVDLSELTRKIKQSGVDAIEAQYIYFAKRLGDVRIDEIKKFMKVANDLGVMVTAGSDFHGASDVYGNYVELGMPDNDIQIDGRLLAALKVS